VQLAKQEIQARLHNDFVGPRGQFDQGSVEIEEERGSVEQGKRRLAEDRGYLIGHPVSLGRQCCNAR
jgi:hypothetical protein